MGMAGKHTTPARTRPGPDEHGAAATRPVLTMTRDEGGIEMKKVTCPPCGAEFKIHSDDELVAIVQKHAKTFHQHNLTRDHILEEAIVVGQDPVMKKVVCPPCGAEFKSHSDDELVEITQKHAKTFHHHEVTREEILKPAKMA